MPPDLTVCRCDPSWTAIAVCVECERHRLHALLLRRGAVQDNPLAALDACDATDRAWSLDDFWRDGAHQ